MTNESDEVIELVAALVGKKKLNRWREESLSSISKVLFQRLELAVHKVFLSLQIGFAVKNSHLPTPHVRPGRGLATKQLI